MLTAMCRPQMPSQMFFAHNTALVPPYNCLVDTNFISSVPLFSCQGLLKFSSTNFS